MNNITQAPESVSKVSAKCVKHDGVVTNVSGDVVCVRIVQTSACVSCKIAAHCNASDKKVKLVEVYGVKDANKYNVGQEVVVCASTDVATRALLYGFGLPLLLLVFVVFIVMWLISDEVIAGLCGLVTLVPYYLVLFMMRNRLRDKFRFWIETN